MVMESGRTPNSEDGDEAKQMTTAKQGERAAEDKMQSKPGRERQ